MSLEKLCTLRNAETIITLLMYLNVTVVEREFFFIPLQVCELVKFMIEHCQRILAEDPSSLFGGPPQRQHTEEKSSGTENMETQQMVHCKLTNNTGYVLSFSMIGNDYQLMQNCEHDKIAEVPELNTEQLHKYTTSAFIISVLTSESD